MIAFCGHGHASTAAGYVRHAVLLYIALLQSHNYLVAATKMKNNSLLEFEVNPQSNVQLMKLNCFENEVCIHAADENNFQYQFDP